MANEKKIVPLVDDGWWEAENVVFNYKGDPGVVKVWLYDDDGHHGTYLARIRNHEVEPDPNASVYDQYEPERVNIDPSSDVFARMVGYLHHKALF